MEFFGLFQVLFALTMLMAMIVLLLVAVGILRGLGR